MVTDHGFGVWHPSIKAGTTWYSPAGNAASYGRVWGDMHVHYPNVDYFATTSQCRTP